MSIITFWSNGKEQVGKTLATAAIATNMSIEHNKRILVISTSYKDNTLLNCFQNPSQKETRKTIMGKSEQKVELENGIQGLFRIIKSGRITPSIISDYTKVIFKDRLELLLNTEKDLKSALKEEDREIIKNYYEMIKIANKFYDYVLVDLDNSIGKEQIQQILQDSDIIVELFTQRWTKINELLELREQVPILKGKNTILLLSKYDRESKYKTKNLTKIFNQRKELNVIPYDTLFFEAAEEGTVAELFLKLRRISDKSDPHAIFVDEVKKITERIVDTNEELKARIG